MAKTYGERWQIVGQIGQGGQSEVFKVIDLWGEYQGDLRWTP